jgi:hypothetical protein
MPRSLRRILRPESPYQISEITILPNYPEKRDSKEAQKAERQKNNAKSQEVARVVLAMDGGREREFKI